MVNFLKNLTYGNNDCDGITSRDLIETQTSQRQVVPRNGKKETQTQQILISF